MPLTVVETADLPTALAPTPDLPFVPETDAPGEFDRQVAVYEALGVPTLLGLPPGGLAHAVAPLRDLAAMSAEPGGDDAAGFVLVLPVDPNDLVPAMRRRDLRGVSVIPRDEVAGYRAEVPVPAGPYLLIGVDVGSEFCGSTPADALTVIRGRGRSGLTIAEGVALAVVRPDRLRPGRCWSLLASRAGNQRVPAVWISERRAKLGWCWDRNPHTWLGAASAAGRVG